MLEQIRGDVAVVAPDVFWDARADALFEGWKDHVEEWKKVGSDYPYHDLGSAITFSKIGRAFGDAMLALEDQP
jgi:alpha-galactosidase